LVVISDVCTPTVAQAFGRSHALANIRKRAIDEMANYPMTPVKAFFGKAR